MVNQKAGLDYFYIDTDLELDDKIALIEAKHGASGFTVIIKLFLKIYGDKGYYYEWNEKTNLIFSRRINIDYEKVNEIVKDAVNFDLFDKKMFEKYKILTSKRVQEHFIEATKRRKTVELYKPYLLLNGQNVNLKRENVNILNENVIQVETNEMKVNEMKVNDKTLALTSIKKSEPKSKIVFNFETEKWEGLTDKDLELFNKAYPAAKLNIEFAKMKAWILASGARGKKSNWKRFINNWLNRCQDRGGTKT